VNNSRKPTLAANPAAQSGGGWEFDPNPTFNEIVFSDEWKNHRPKEYFEYRELWSSVPENCTELDFPVHLDIETTTHCNLLCPMCPRTLQLNAGDHVDNFMTRDEFEAIVDQGAEHGAKSLKLQYLGEPTLHKDLAWQIGYAKDKGFVDVIINSNGTALTEKNSRSFLEAGVDGVFVSLDAVNPKLYEQQRVGASLGRTIDNIYTLSKLRDEIRPGTQLRVSMILFDGDIWRKQFMGLQAMWADIVDAVGYSYFVERDADLQVDYETVEGFHCPQPFQRMFLKNNGNVTICCVDDKDKVVVGNWKEQPLHEIWNSPQYREVRRIHAEGEYQKMDMCRKCYMPVSVKNQEKRSIA